MTAKRGFSLLEVLVATVIMGIAVTGLIIGLSNAVRNASRLADYDRATALAYTKMNDLLLDVNLPLDGAVEGTVDPGQSGGLSGGSGAPNGWRAVLKPFDVPPNAGPGTVILQEVALQIWWQPVSGTRRSMQLQGYRQARIPISQAP